MPGITLGSVGAYAAAILLLFLLGKALALPMRLIGKLILNGVAGGVALFLINLLGAKVGVNIGINPLTALIAGFLGLPGIVMLVLLQYIFLL
ncbi:pro-sigmaK processing inhibitor BofA family protein [Christensenella sp. MSJ-20]|uniref:pro-sigmaK processing inhibitor BofA family protein n=1 Tax=Christensenella sp. MSJ-20 TaxID=2841518 RepID=UPI000D797BD8|nr:MAG: SigmaK-factor processing regulatory BofA [Bacillota bacterium]QWT55249.1 pro-sigmaK processing inhibitor BofA family protein [Christensenella sp. MSJ-20]